MKKLLLILLCCFVIPLYSPVHAEVISSFSSNIAIQKDGTVQVKEIIIYDFEKESRHGILRDLSTVKTNIEGKKFRLTFIPESVTDELGVPYQWKTEDNGDILRVKIGDPNQTITGIKTYQITYIVRGALTYFSDHDELYWNSTGNGWDVPIQNASTRITLPDQINSQDLKMVCYTGYEGSTAAECSTNLATSLGESSTTHSLSAGEGLTVSFSFPINIVAHLEPEEIHNIFENPFVLAGVLFIAFMWYIAAPFYLGYRWWRYGRDPKSTVGEASVWFDAPKTKKLRKLTPAETGTLLDEQADLSDLAATIVDLARRGWLTIVEENKKYLLKKNQSAPQEVLQPFEKILYEGIFKNNDQVDLKDADLTDTASKTKRELYTAVVQEGFFDKNPDVTRGIYVGIGVFGLMTGNILLFFSSLLFGRHMPRKTQYGSDEAAVGRALKKFLSSQEKFLKFQAEKMAMFEKLLPYAVAFGVEKLWAERFSDLDLQQPTWYASSDSTFHSVIFVNSLSNSMSSFRAAATPTTSSSGFSSGSSGGFSGGGGGGGGGGSW